MQDSEGTRDFGEALVDQIVNQYLWHAYTVGGGWNWGERRKTQSEDYQERVVATIRKFFNKYRGYHVYHILGLDKIEAAIIEGAEKHVKTVVLDKAAADARGASAFYTPLQHGLTLGKPPEQDVTTIVHEMNHAAVALKMPAERHIGRLETPSESKYESLRAMTDVLFDMADYLLFFEKAVNANEIQDARMFFNGGIWPSDNQAQSIEEVKRSSVLTHFGTKAYSSLKIDAANRASFKKVFGISWDDTAYPEAIRKKYEALGENWKKGVAGKMELREPWQQMKKYGD